MQEVRSLRDISIATAHKLWNEGFTGYITDLRMDEDTYLGRLHREGLQPEWSVVLYKDGRPVGFTLNGIRETGGGRTAWNGGTAIVPDMRGQGLGSPLMAANLERYREAGAHQAVLEAMVQNDPAVALYRRFGYAVKERTLFYTLPGELRDVPAPRPAGGETVIREEAVESCAGLGFYRADTPWQAHYLSLKGGRCLIAERSGAPAAYLPLRRLYDGSGHISAIHLYRAGFAQGLQEEERREITAALCAAAVEGYRPGVRLGGNHIGGDDLEMRSWLEAAGLETAHELYVMELDL